MNLKQLIFMVLIVLFSAINSYGYDGMKFTVEGLTYKVLSEEEQTCEVSEALSTLEGVVEISNKVLYTPDLHPDQAKAYTVTSIGSGAFEGCNKEFSVDLSKCRKMTSIQSFAFEMCRHLTSVILPESLETVGVGCFKYCFQLKEITLPAKVTIIPTSFAHSSGLEKIVIEGPVTEIHQNAFSITPMREFEIPSTVTVMQKNVFVDSKIEKLHFPASVSIPEGTPCTRCPELSTVTVDPENPWLTSLDNALYSKDMTTLLFYPAYNEYLNLPESVTKIGAYSCSGCKLKEVDVPDCVTTLDLWAFQGCADLEVIRFGRNVNKIGQDIVKDCSNLKAIYSYNPEPPTIASTTFSGFYALPLYVPEQSVEAYEEAEYWRNFLNIEGVKDIQTGIDIVETSDESTAEYFDLNGRRVMSKPASGVYIKRSNNKVTKVLVK